MAKRYLGGGISFEQKDVYQEFSEDEGGGGGGSTTLAGLTDVDISNPSDGQVLVYNATSGKWENGRSPSGSGLLIVNALATTTNDGSTLTFDKTFSELKSAYDDGAVILCLVTTEDNVNSVRGVNTVLLTYYPAQQFPFPAPEMFTFEASFLTMQNDVHGCFVNGEMTAGGTNVAIHTSELAVAN